MTANPTTNGRTYRLSNWAVGHTRWLLVGVLVITAALAVPFLTMQPTETASQEPTGVVFDARDAIEERFASSVFVTFAIVEDRAGDLLRVEPLTELLANSEALRSDPEVGPKLFTYYDADYGTDVTGIWTIADIIDAQLPGGLATATDADVKAVAAELIAQRGPTELGLSALTTADSDGPVSPAINTAVLSDDTILGFGGGGVRLGADTASEEYSRSVIELLRGDETANQAWGVAIDVNLTSEEQGAAAGPFIGFTIAAVLAIVGLTFRSYWVLAVTGGALATLIIWLEGITNLIGLKDDLVLSFIVPIAMISFGVDSVFHAVSRYREGTSEGKRPRAAFVVGMTGVAGALILALVSDSAAFLANTTSGIESIVQFGLGATIALMAAFVLLAFMTPLTIMLIEDKVGRPEPTRRRRIIAVAGSFGAAMLAMASVLLSVFIYPPFGLLALAAYLACALVLPYRFASRSDEWASTARGSGRASTVVGNAVVSTTRRPLITVGLIAALTVGATLLALQVPTEFDVKDFFAADSDFVVGLDKLDEHGGESAGEPANILIEADLTEPVAVAAVADFVDAFAELDSDRFQRNDDGTQFLAAGFIDVIGDLWSQPAALGALTATTGVTLTDDDGDGIPDTTDQLAAVIAATREIGVPIDQERSLWTPDAVRSVLWAEGERSATVFSTGLPGSRQVENIAAARAELAPLVDTLESSLRTVDPDASVTATGGPIARQESLDAVARALQISLPIAVAVCFMIAAVFMRSPRLALIVIMPTLVVVAWLYAFMFVFGFAINLVTATIGALSIGIGIDFAIHFTERWREEYEDRGDSIAAVRAAAEGTGLALVGSAASSIVGFAIMAFAPMPLFASYGLLTSVMIAMALLASLIALPPLLVLTTRRDTRVRGESDIDVRDQQKPRLDPARA